MSKQSTIDDERLIPRSYPSLLVDGLKLWGEARRSAKYDHSIFIWIPKNAGTSVYEMLRPHGLVKLKSPRAVRLSFRNSGRVTFGHMAIGSLVEAGMVSRAFVEKAFKFALTRDPYARAVSMYEYLSKMISMSNWHRQPSFCEFLKLIADGFYDRIGTYNQRGLSQCNPQIEWLRPYWPEKLYQVENMNEFITDIGERWGLSEHRISHLNRSVIPGNFELTLEEKALIEKIYAEDFEALGYARR